MTNEAQNLPYLQWFPGHMKKAERLIKENLRLVDVVFELLDARIPVSSANPMIKELIEENPRLVVLNKADLADSMATRRWLATFRSEDVRAVAVDAISGYGIKALVAAAEDLARPLTERLVAKGVRPRAARCMVLGIPNVGKSSLINRLAGVQKATTENRPGVTRAKQWIKIGKNLDLLDMPGLLWSKFEDQNAALKLAFTGAVKDDIYDREAVACLLLEVLAKNYTERLVNRFRLQPEDLPQDDGYALLQLVGKKRGCLRKGGVVDIEKAVFIVLKEFRAGKFGKITLDEPPISNA